MSQADQSPPQPKPVAKNECVDGLGENQNKLIYLSLALQFWSALCAAAMETFRVQGCDKLEDCDGSIKMCNLINDLADAMNANRPQNAVTLESQHTKAIDDFLEYFIDLKDWANKKLRSKLEAAEKDRVEMLRKQGKNPRGSTAYQTQEDYIFSDSTDIARFNQDALERFFGLVRQSCGGNTHPEPRVFAQLFRLLSMYALVKPVRGSNITGGEMITTLLNLKDLNSCSKQERKEALSKKFDEIISNDHVADHDHDYIGESIDEFALAYVGGYVARHAKKYCNNCDQCLESLKK
ncbi:hypothetical protein FOCC_FOCC015932 [Frankliniella occidentalis]|nr:hypothetical protein FOCC_FOCC015932 [Frankliniella occidentalis]